jgi:chromosome segregation ATPase
MEISKMGSTLEELQARDNDLKKRLESFASAFEGDDDSLTVEQTAIVALRGQLENKVDQVDRLVAIECQRVNEIAEYDRQLRATVDRVHRLTADQTESDLTTGHLRHQINELNKSMGARGRSNAYEVCKLKEDNRKLTVERNDACDELAAHKDRDSHARASITRRLDIAVAKRADADARLREAHEAVDSHGRSLDESQEEVEQLKAQLLESKRLFTARRVESQEEVARLKKLHEHYRQESGRHYAQYTDVKFELADLKSKCEKGEAI